jgi:hypothetical protein
VLMSLKRIDAGGGETGRHGPWLPQIWPAFIQRPRGERQAGAAVPGSAMSDRR